MIDPFVLRAPGYANPGVLYKGDQDHNPGKAIKLMSLIKQVIEKVERGRYITDDDRDKLAAYLNAGVDWTLEYNEAREAVDIIVAFLKAFKNEI